MWNGSNHANENLLLGRLGKYKIAPKFHVSYDVRKFHTYVVGLTGRGKSKFLQNSLVQDIIAGRGCAVIDPHGDLAKDVLRTLIDKGYFDCEENYKKIVYVSPRRRDFIIPFNVLANPQNEIETYEIAQRVISSFQRTWAKTLAEPPRFQQIMRSSLAVLIENNRPLTDLYRLLTDDDFREGLLAYISDIKVKADCEAFFHQEYNHWGKERTKMIASTTNKISALTDNPSIFYMLGQKENHLDIRKIMDEGKILLVDLGDCDHETKRLFGTMIVTGFEKSALSRANSPIESRIPYYLYVDEFQDFACHPGSADTFSQMLSQVRKFKLHMILANQSIAQLNPSLQTALGNAQTIVSFRISRADAEVLVKVLREINLGAIKHTSKTETQHPIDLQMNEQWESHIQRLTKLKVRQMAVKTADDRTAIIWADYVSTKNVNDKKLEEIISKIQKINGIPFKKANQNLVAKPIIEPMSFYSD
jgi:hypothetical protein